MNIRKSLLALGAASSLALSVGCSSTSTPAAATAGSPASGQVDATTQAWIAGLTTNVNGALAQLNTSIAAAAPLFKNACGLGNALNTAYGEVGAGLASASDNSAEAVADAGLVALCASAPSDVNSAAAQALAAALTIQKALNAAKPGSAPAVSTAAQS